MITPTIEHHETKSDSICNTCLIRLLYQRECRERQELIVRLHDAEHKLLRLYEETMGKGHEDLHLC